MACQQGGTWGDVARACKISEFTALEKAKLYGIKKARARNDEIKNQTMWGLQILETRSETCAVGCSWVYGTDGRVRQDGR